MKTESEIKINVLEQLLVDIWDMNPDYIEEYIKEQLDIEKNGI